MGRPIATPIATPMATPIAQAIATPIAPSMAKAIALHSTKYLLKSLDRCKSGLWSFVFGYFLKNSQLSNAKESE
jgi:hypothetical protein